MRIYENLESLPVILFWKIIRDRNAHLLDKKFSESKKYTPENTILLTDIWNALYDEVFLSRNDKESKLFLKKKSKEMKLLAKIDIIQTILTAISDLQQNEEVLRESGDFEKILHGYYSSLNKVELRMQISNKKSIFENLARATNIFIAINERYLIAKSNTDKQVDIKVKNIYENVRNAEAILERSISDVSKMSVLEWMSFEASVEKKLQSNKENTLKNAK